MMNDDLDEGLDDCIGDMIGYDTPDVAMRLVKRSNIIAIGQRYIV